MPTLDFKGKQFVYTHHLSVPFRALEVDPKRSLPAKGRKPSLDDNLIIHGDNLHALKALLPTHAGKIDCIYIDPPYNTGNEKWCYNDAVNSPLMREWLKANSPVDKEDLERHEKWLCMMWPRLKMLKELLAEDGAIFISIDDNEVHRLRTLMDELWGEEGFAAQVCLLCNPKGRVLSQGFADTHEYILVYSKKAHNGDFSTGKTGERIEREYPLSDVNGPYRELELRNTHREFNRQTRQNLWYPIFVNEKSGEISLKEGIGWKAVYPVWDDGFEGCWTWNPAKALSFQADLVARKTNGRWKIFRKGYAEGARRKATTIWTDPDYHSEKGQATYEEIMAQRFTHPPKSVDLVKFIVSLVPKEDALVLDSFAGSGTTAHAVLDLNRRDGGNRRFILVECEDYADSLTAERVRRVISGYKFEGTKREELWTQPLTFSSLKKASELLEKADSFEMFDGERFDRIVKTVEDGALKVIGEKKITEKVEGLGGSFAFCELGPEISVEGMLTGKQMPDYASLARYVFYTATGRTLEKDVLAPRKDWLIGETDVYRLHLIYKPDVEWLRSKEAALNASMAEAIQKANTGKKRCLVFAAVKFISQKELTAQYRIEFCQLPYAIHRVLGD